jgi:hypothetical protein
MFKRAGSHNIEMDIRMDMVYDDGNLILRRFSHDGSLSDGTFQIRIDSAGHTGHLP